MGNYFSFSSKQQKRLFILRGPPGSGKTTLANLIVKQNNGGCIFSVDEYFINENIYKFDSTKYIDAQNWTIENVVKAMQNQESLIIIDNTNSRKWEAKKYVENAIKYQYEVIIMEPDTEWKKDINILFDKNVHGIPKRHIKRMIAKWEDDFTIENILKSEEPWINK